jgi:DNA-binding NarL/FixJ family response regulator
VTKSVLIADDSQAIRWSLRTAFERAGYTVCGEAIDGIDLLEKAARTSPDLVVLDLRMPKMSGVEAASLLRKKLPKIKIVLLTLYDVGPSVAAEAGVTAVFAKQDGIQQLPEQLQKLFDQPEGSAVEG